MAGGTTDAARGVDTLGQGSPYRLALPGIGTAQGNEIVIANGEIQAGGGYPGQPDGGGPVIAHPDGPGDHIVLLQNAIQQLHRQAAALVLEFYGQRLGSHTLTVKGGQTLQRILALGNRVVDVAQVHNVAAIRQVGLQGRLPEVTHTAGRILLGLSIQRPSAIHPYLVRVGREAPVLGANQPGKISLSQFLTIIGVKQHAGGIDLHLIAGAAGVQRDGTALRIILNHTVSSFNRKSRAWQKSGKQRSPYRPCLTDHIISHCRLRFICFVGFFCQISTLPPYRTIKAGKALRCNALPALLAYSHSLLLEVF